MAGTLSRLLWVPCCVWTGLYLVASLDSNGGFILIRFSEDPSCGDELPRFFGAVSTGKTTMARLALATGPRLGHAKGNEGRG
jgi:hypothetical protein